METTIIKKLDFDFYIIRDEFGVFYFIYRNVLLCPYFTGIKWYRILELSKKLPKKYKKEPHRYYK